MSRIEIETPIGPISADLDNLSEDLSYLLSKVKKTDKVDESTTATANATTSETTGHGFLSSGFLIQETGCRLE